MSGKTTIELGNLPTRVHETREGGISYVRHDLERHLMHLYIFKNYSGF